MNPTLQALLNDATRLTRAGRLQEATDTIQRALGAGAAPPWRPMPDAPRWPGADAFWRPAAGADHADVIDVEAVEAPAGVIAPDRTGDTTHRSRADRAPVEPGRTDRVPVEPDQADRAPLDRSAPAGTFEAGIERGGARPIGYKLYRPATDTTPSPLIVMLHGCTQDPDQFARGTAMNARAALHGCHVLYPEQTAEANASRCWNWFEPAHQRRGAGEPALIAGLVAAILRDHPIDPQRVYIAGLSAGGAMAAICAAAYPELFAAVGVHSGLPPQAARGLPEALMAMKRGAPPVARPARSGTVPMIVFHGDRDRLVSPRNGEQLVAGHVADGSTVQTEAGVGAGGRRYTRTLHRDGESGVVAEHWVIHGAGHAWSGGDPSGSHADARGPDASAAMLRFFLDQPRRR